MWRFALNRAAARSTNCRDAPASEAEQTTAERRCFPQTPVKQAGLSFLLKPVAVAGTAAPTSPAPPPHPSWTVLAALSGSYIPLNFSILRSCNTVVRFIDPPPTSERSGPAPRSSRSPVHRTRTLMPTAARSPATAACGQRPASPVIHSLGRAVRTATVVIHHTAEAISHPRPHPPANSRHRPSPPRRSQIPIARAPAAPLCPSLPRFPPLEVFGRRPPVRASRHVSGRHPKTFTQAEATWSSPVAEASRDDGLTVNPLAPWQR